jgi:hypothetical protein
LRCLGWIFGLGLSDNIKGVTIDMASRSSAITELDGERLSKEYNIDWFGNASTEDHTSDLLGSTNRLTEIISSWEYGFNGLVCKNYLV